MTRIIILLLTVYFFSSCINDNRDKSQLTHQKTEAPATAVANQHDTSIISCDSIYVGKGYSITLSTFDTFTSDETKWNALFLLHKTINGHNSELYRDSIYNTVHDVEFEDYNSDGVKDILVQSYSDGRSNWTSYLYLVDTANDKLKKVKGFETIKNAKWNSEMKLIENYVLSGRNWSSFYEIKGNSIKDYDIVIYDDLVDSMVYERQYRKAIAKIKAIRKNNR
jgi:hypothetical protein